MGVRELPVADGASSLPVEAVMAAHDRIVRACLFAGLPPMDAEDLAARRATTTSATASASSGRGK